MDLKVICVVLGLSVFALAGPAVDNSGAIENSVSQLSKRIVKTTDI